MAPPPVHRILSGNFRRLEKMNILCKLGDQEEKYCYDFITTEKVGRCLPTFNVA